MPKKNGDASGKTTTTTGQTTTIATSEPGDNDAARTADFESQLARANGDALRFAEKLHERVFQLRQRAQAAEEQVPGEGMVVIKAEDLVLLKSYKALGTPTEIVDKGAQLSKLQKYQMVSEAATVAGMNPKVLSTLLPTDATLEIGEATGDDGAATRIVTLVQGEDTTALDAYAQAQWSDFLPALKAEKEQQSAGTPWIQQSGSTAGDTGNGMNPILKEKMEEAKARALPKTN